MRYSGCVVSAAVGSPDCPIVSFALCSPGAGWRVLCGDAGHDQRTDGCRHVGGRWRGPATKEVTIKSSSIWRWPLGPLKVNRKQSQKFWFRFAALFELYSQSPNVCVKHLSSEHRRNRAVRWRQNGRASHPPPFSFHAQAAPRLVGTAKRLEPGRDGEEVLVLLALVKLEEVDLDVGAAVGVVHVELRKGKKGGDGILIIRFGE